MPKKKVVVGMSGGVDSSVAALLLKEQGYDVIGVTMQIWQDEEACTIGDNGGCCGLKAAEDARRIAALLEIPHYVMNFKDIFKKSVIDNFISEYLKGNTPNPCIRCNRYVKWEALLSRSVEIGADYIATGHYAKVKRLHNGRFAICKSVTDKKDQTYALYNLTQFQLAHTLMPIGVYCKEDVREIAKKAGFPVADKPDSQEICFIPDNDYGAFIDKNADVPGRGNFIDKNGNVLGSHSGIHKYTIGQRKGLNISLGSPMYVCEIRPDSNEVVLGTDEETYTERIVCYNINYMAVNDFKHCKNMTAKIRYGSREYPCTVEYQNNGCLLCRFNEKVRAATPGQAIVFYRGEQVLGGGTIGRETVRL